MGLLPRLIRKILFRQLRKLTMWSMKLNCMNMNIFLVNLRNNPSLRPVVVYTVRLNVKETTETSYMRTPPVHLQEPHDLRLVVEGEQLGGDGGRGGTAHGDAHHGDLLRVLNEVWCKFQYY